MTSNGAPLGEHDLIFTRTFAAPRALVFSLWTDAKHMAHWWGPNNFTTTVFAADARTGGAIHLEMRGPAGSGYEGPFPLWGSYLEVVPPERIVLSTQLKTERGDVFLETLNTVTLTERDGTTTLTLEIRVVKAGPEAAGPLAGMKQGWDETLDRMAALAQAAAGQ